MKQIEYTDLPFYGTVIALVLVLASIILSSCGHQVGIVGLGTGFRVGGGEYGVSYGEGLFGTFVTRDGVNFKAELDSTQGFTYDPASNTYKGIRSIEYSVAPQVNGYAVDFARENPEVAKIYYDALVKYYEVKEDAPAAPLISDEKSKEATRSVSDVLKAAIEKAKAIVDGDKDAGEESFQCSGDCNFDDLTGNATISWQLSAALKVLSFDGYQRRFPSSDEYYQTATEHFVSQLVALRSLGKHTTPLRLKYLTVEKGVVTRLMFVYIPKEGEPSDVECPNCCFVDPDDAD